MKVLNSYNNAMNIQTEETVMAHFVKVMLVEDEPEVCAGFRAAFTRYNRTMSLAYETDSEQQALDYLEIHDVDVLILDIELREGDGLSLLDAIETRGLEKPFIIVVTNTESRVTLSFMRAHGADYIYLKTNQSYSPQKVVSVIEKIYPYQRIEADRCCMHELESFSQIKDDEITRHYIEDELEKMGFKRRQVGFAYIAEAIFLVMSDKEGQHLAPRNIYPKIAGKYHVTQVSVERGIRNAIESTFTGAHVSELHYRYPFDYDEEKGRPGNTEFLKHMAERLRM